MMRTFLIIYSLRLVFISAADLSKSRTSHAHLMQVSVLCMLCVANIDKKEPKSALQ